MNDTSFVTAIRYSSETKRPIQAAIWPERDHIRWTGERWVNHVGEEVDPGSWRDLPKWKLIDKNVMTYAEAVELSKAEGIAIRSVGWPEHCFVWWNRSIGQWLDDRERIRYPETWSQQTWGWELFADEPVVTEEKRDEPDEPPPAMEEGKSMKFWEAIRAAMEEGKSIRAASWPKVEFVRWNPDSCNWEDEGGSSCYDVFDGSYSESWEIYEESPEEESTQPYMEEPMKLYAYRPRSSCGDEYCITTDLSEARDLADLRFGIIRVNGAYIKDI